MTFLAGFGLTVLLSFIVTGIVILLALFLKDEYDDMTTVVAFSMGVVLLMFIILTSVLTVSPEYFGLQKIPEAIEEVEK